MKKAPGSPTPFHCLTALQCAVVVSSGVTLLDVVVVTTGLPSCVCLLSPSLLRDCQPSDIRREWPHCSGMGTGEASGLTRTNVGLRRQRIDKSPRGSIAASRSMLRRVSRRQQTGPVQRQDVAAGIEITRPGESSRGAPMAAFCTTARQPPDHRKDATRRPKHGENPDFDAFRYHGSPSDGAPLQHFASPCAPHDGTVTHNVFSCLDACAFSVLWNECWL